MSTWKSTEMGGRDQAFCEVLAERVTVHVNDVSVWPWMRGILDGTRTKRQGQSVCFFSLLPEVRPVELMKGQITHFQRM